MDCWSRSVQFIFSTFVFLDYMYTSFSNCILKSDFLQIREEQDTHETYYMMWF
jgi:hypothetical protein